ncbi:aspartate/glutamate racemase family protein [Neisseriaceae bacterium TC5R-5]|nr:aspartate/glutamate racemase family protein [Neisseriaceae bacterium TC5R-5]
MHIGLIVGIGPAATDYYYRYLISTLARAGQDLNLTMAHADTKTLLQNQSEGNIDAQVAIYHQLSNRLQRAGIEQIAITSIAGHFCIDAFKEVSPIPVIDLLDVIKLEIKRRGLKRVGLLGTRMVMETQFYGVLDDVEVIAPVDNLLEVHEAYVSMASAGIATAEHREVFMQAGQDLSTKFGCESIMLAGTDLALVFKEGDQPGFDTFNCAEVHALAIANAAMTP